MLTSLIFCYQKIYLQVAVALASNNGLEGDSLRGLSTYIQGKFQIVVYKLIFSALWNCTKREFVILNL